MTEVNAIPDPTRGRRNAPWVNQLRAFLRSGKQTVKVDIPEQIANKAYQGLTSASQRQEFKGRVIVRRNRSEIYLAKGE